MKLMRLFETTSNREKPQNLYVIVPAALCVAFSSEKAAGVSRLFADGLLIK
jgi:hypothetical protein